MEKRPSRSDAVSVVVFSPQQRRDKEHYVIVMHPRTSVYELADVLPGGCVRGGNDSYLAAAVRHLARKTGLILPEDTLTQLSYTIPAKREGGTHFFFTCVAPVKLSFQSRNYRGDRDPYWASIWQIINSREIEPSHQTAIVRAWECYQKLLLKVISQQRSRVAHAVPLSGVH